MPPSVPGSTVQTPAQLLGALAHGAEADARPAVGGEPAAVVGDLELEGSIRREADGARLCVCVADDVRDGFQPDPVRGHLDRRGQLGELPGPGDGDLQPAVEVGGLSRTAPGSRVVEGRRSQVVDEPADVGDDALGLLPLGASSESAAAGSRSTRLAAASSWSAMPASAGPRPRGDRGGAGGAPLRGR